MRVPSIVGAIGAVALAAALGCGPAATVQPTSTTPSTPAPVEQCLFFHSTASLADTIVVALFDSVDPSHAPEWRNQCERLVFHHLYESVIVPPHCDMGLLAEARVSEDGRVATLRLRDDVRFWDGTPVTSRDVAETIENARAFTDGIDSIATPDNRTIDVYVSNRRFPSKALASPAVAITRRSADIWPTGTGPYRIVNAGARGGNLTLQPSFDSTRPVIQFIDARGIDARDMLDPAFRPRIDLMIVDDPNVVEYATSQNRFQATALGASKAYFLLSVTRVQALEKGEVVPAFPDSLKNEIARYAIRNANARSLGSSDARWNDLGDCNPPLEDAPISAVPTTRRVLYDASDPTARDLADRIIALATTTSTAVTAIWAAVPGLNSASPRPVAVGVSAAELAASLGSGSEFAYVVALPLGRPESCFLPRELLRRAPWLGMGRTPLHLKTIPLVGTGPYAVATRSGSGANFALNMNVVGDILIVGTSRTEAP